ncbi:MAG: YdaU family protein [Vibrio gallaecicus]
MHYYQFNIGDYATSTQHLEPMEDLAYRRMLDLYYSKESPLPKDIDQIARLIRMRSHTDCIAIVLQEFFTNEKDGYHNKGADKNLSKVYKKSEAARKSAEARWNKNKNLESCERNANVSKPHSEEDANGMLPNTQYPIPNTQDKKSRAKRFAPPTHKQAFEYFKERGLSSETESQRFIDFYEMKGWMVGRNKMKDWKAAIRNWMKNCNTQKSNQGVNAVGADFSKPEGW